MLMFADIDANGQGKVYRVAGTGNYGFSGDGGPALDANMTTGHGIGAFVMDQLGNFYFYDISKRIRRVDGTTNIITTIAGTGVQGFSGDGGPAINAQIMLGAIGVDPAGNVYIARMGRIRKIDMTTGIINTIAGTGDTTSDSGDGGPAINATFGDKLAIYIDPQSNIYVSNKHTIRKIDGQTGIVTKVAGGNGAGFSGDGGPAVNAQLSGLYITGMVKDNSNNLFFCDLGNFRIRKVDENTGIITTVAGTGVQGTSGDGGPAPGAQFHTMYDLDIDGEGNLYMTDAYQVGGYPTKIRKINATTNMITAVTSGGDTLDNIYDGMPAIQAATRNFELNVDAFGNIFFNNTKRIYKITGDSVIGTYNSANFSVQVAYLCEGAKFMVSLPAYLPNYSVTTSYGDGSSTNNTIINYNNTGFSSFKHLYASTGTFNVKHVLYNNSVAVDSIEYPFDYSMCRMIPVELYYDFDNDCSFTQGIDYHCILPSLTQVDSNGITIDTVSTTAGFYYQAKGDIGDIYTFTVVETPGGLYASCPINGTIYDTISSVYNMNKSIGFSCNSPSTFDLAANALIRSSVFRGRVIIVPSNYSCLAQDAEIKLTFSPKYIFDTASPAPISQNGNVLTWNMNDLSSVMPTPQSLKVWLSDNGQLLTMGDTVHYYIEITPTTGDINPANNTIVVIDTVTAPWDPNAVYVSPSGCVTPGTKLEYTVTFENMGNDTAHNIIVIDTLNDGVDMESFRIVTSSHVMSVSKINSMGYNILKFYFPNIMLPDSSSPARHGMVQYTINTLNNYPIGSAVTNRAGIYFDYMDPVITNTASTTMCWPAKVEQVASKNNTITVHPNPATDVLKIQSSGKLTRYVILNAIGQELMQDNLNARNEINIKSLPAGIYYLKGWDDNDVYSAKFLKQD